MTDDDTTLEDAAADLRATAAQSWEEADAAHAGYFSELADAATEGGFSEAELTAEVERQIAAGVSGEEADQDTDSGDDDLTDAEQRVVNALAKAGDAGLSKEELLSTVNEGVEDDGDLAADAERFGKAREPSEDERAEVLGGQIMTIEHDIKAASGNPQELAALSHHLDELTTKRAVSAAKAFMIEKGMIADDAAEVFP